MMTPEQTMILNLGRTINCLMDRLVRVESRLCKLMVASGVDPRDTDQSGLDEIKRDLVVDNQPNS
jgi:hypothetical protein